MVTGVDDHSRFCVMATVVERATGRAVCLAFAAGAGPVRGAGGGDHRQRQAVHRPVRQGAGRCCSTRSAARNGITHRLTAPASPNQNGKVERFHGTFRPDFLDDAGPFTSIEAAQAAVDAWVADYNTDRPHQALDEQLPVTPAERFAPVPAEQRELVALWLPADSNRSPATPMATGVTPTSASTLRPSPPR